MYHKIHPLKAYSAVQWLILRMYNPHHNLRTLSVPKKENPYPTAVIPRVIHF